MKEKKYFVFFVCDQTQAHEKSEEISNVYMNKVAIDENNQSEIFKIEFVPIIFQKKRYHLTNGTLSSIKNVFISFQARKGKVKVS